MKYEILRVIEKDSQIDYEKFVNSILKFKRDLKVNDKEFDINS